MGAVLPTPLPKDLDPRVAAAAGGDRAAAQALLLELLPRIRNLVRYLVFADAEVDDIGQLVLVELLRSFGNYRGEGSLRSWADRITMRVTFAQLRRRRGEQRRHQAALPDLHAVRADPERPDEYALRRETVRWLDALPAEQREAVVLHHVAGVPVPELAVLVGVPFETARSRLRLGVAKLREQVQRTRGES